MLLAHLAVASVHEDPVQFVELPQAVFNSLQVLAEIEVQIGQVARIHDVGVMDHTFRSQVVDGAVLAVAVVSGRDDVDGQALELHGSPGRCHHLRDRRHLLAVALDVVDGQVRGDHPQLDAVFARGIGDGLCVVDVVHVAVRVDHGGDGQIGDGGHRVEQLGGPAVRQGIDQQNPLVANIGGGVIGVDGDEVGSLRQALH